MATKKTAKPRNRPTTAAKRKRPTVKVDLAETLREFPAEDREGLVAGAELLLHSLVTAPRAPKGAKLPEDSEAVPADVAELFERFLTDLRVGVEKTRQ